MTSMTYGQLPSRDAFDAAFDAECPMGYHIALGRSDSAACEGFQLGDGTWTADQLWQAITEIATADGDMITVDADSEYENVYQVFYPGTDRPYVEIGPDSTELIEWANKFGKESKPLIETESRAIEALNYASAYGQPGTDWTRHDAAMDLVSSIMDTLGFEWV